MIDRDPMVDSTSRGRDRYLRLKGSLLEDTARLHNRGAFMGDLSEPTVNPARPCLCTGARS